MLQKEAMTKVYFADFHLYDQLADLAYDMYTIRERLTIVYVFIFAYDSEKKTNKRNLGCPKTFYYSLEI